jgi:hypothetical protein
MHPILSREEKRCADLRAFPEAPFYIFVVGLVLVAAFCFFMIATS